MEARVRLDDGGESDSDGSRSDDPAATQPQPLEPLDSTALPTLSQSSQAFFDCEATQQIIPRARWPSEESQDPDY